MLDSFPARLAAVALRRLARWAGRCFLGEKETELGRRRAAGSDQDRGEARPVESTRDERAGEEGQGFAQAPQEGSPGVGQGGGASEQAIEVGAPVEVGERGEQHDLAARGDETCRELVQGVRASPGDGSEVGQWRRGRQEIEAAIG
jgi:hypothetical protein